MNFNGKYFRPIGFYKKGKIKVNYEEKKLDFIAINLQDKNLNLDVSWSFDMLKEKINLKLKDLAIVYADSKYIDGCEYFHYNEIKFFKLKSFETFITMVENGEIEICFNIGVFKNGNKIGKIHGRGVGFSIDEKNISKLYHEIKL